MGIVTLICIRRVFSEYIIRKGKVICMSELRNALVTGAGSGIGRAVVTGLLKHGFTVTLVGRHEDSLKETAMLAGEFKSNALVLPADVSDPDAVGGVFRCHMERFGRLDLLFNNAGVNTPRSYIEDMDFGDWQRVVGTNLNGCFLCSQQAIKIMKNQNPRGGRIVNNGSVSAQVPRPLAAAYNATKHAILGLSKSISLEGRTFDICCTQLDIGNAATDRTANLAVGALQPDGSTRAEALMHADNITETILYLAGLPLEANVPFLTITANAMPFIGRG